MVIREMAGQCRLPTSLLQSLGVGGGGAGCVPKRFRFTWEGGGEAEEEDHDDFDAEEWERHESHHGGVPDHG